MSTQRFGVVLRDMPGPVPGALVPALDAAAAAGADRLQIPSVEWLAPDLDPAALASARTEASARGMGISAQLGVLNGASPERMAPLLALGDGDALLGLAKTLEAATIVGIEDLHFTIGTLEDRVDELIPWAERLERSTELVIAAAEVARGTGVRLVLKTHEEMSSQEVVDVLAATGGEVRAGFSGVNLLVGLEDPVVAARRLVPYVHTFFVDDASLVRTDAGFARRMQPLGGGIVDWPSIAAMCPDARTTLDVHRAEFTIDWFQPDWVRSHPHVTIAELTALVAASVGTADDPQASPQERFAAGVARLRSGWDTAAAPEPMVESAA